MSTNSPTSTETTPSRTDLAPDAGREADTDASTDRPSDWTARCQRQFSPHRTARLGNLVDGRNEAMPDPGDGSADADDESAVPEDRDSGTRRRG